MAIHHKPIHQIRIGSVKASIWEQSSKTDSFLTVTFSQSYKNKQDQWQNGHSYQVQEIESLIDAAIDAKDWMRRYRQTQGRAA